MISVIGRKDAGKSTLLGALAAEFGRRNRRVMTIDESTHTPQSDPISLARRYLDEADIVLVEGFKRAPLPKIEVYRLAAGPAPLFDPAASDSIHWVCIVTDDAGYRAAIPVLRFNDTGWLVTLANLAWDRAKILAA